MIMSILRQNIGVDVSKEFIDVNFTILDEKLNTNSSASRKFKNQMAGFKSLIEWASKAKDNSIPLHFTMEPTGVYHEKLAYFLYENKQMVHLVVTKKAKRFSESLKSNSKTDKIDAKALGRMGAERNLDVWEPSSPVFILLKGFTRERSSLIKMRTMLKNQRESVLHSANYSKKTINRINQLIKKYDKLIKKIETDISELLDQYPDIKDKVEKVTTIPGVAIQTAVVIVAETNGFALFNNIKQVTAFAGLDVRLRQSGKWKGKSKISKAGNVHIRKALYFPAFTSIRYINNYKIVYDRITQRKEKPMVAAVAIQRKLLGLIYTIWKNDSVYQKDYNIA